MKPSKFKHIVLEHKSRMVILIEDTKEMFEARRSVIVDMARVIDHIELVEKLKAEDCIVLVRGVCLTWDAWDARTGEFAGFSKTDWPTAFRAYQYIDFKPQTKLSTI